MVGQVYEPSTSIENAFKSIAKGDVHCQVANPEESQMDIEEAYGQDEYKKISDAIQIKNQKKTTQKSNA